MDNHKQTLGYHRDMVKALLGEDSPAIHFLDDKIKEAPHGRDEEVIVDEGQVVNMLLTIHVEGYHNRRAGDEPQGN